MNFCLLTRFHNHNQSSSFVARLVEEAEKQGHNFQLINPQEVSFDLAPGIFPIRYRGQAFPEFDLVHYALRWDDDHTWEVVDMLRAQNRPVLPTQRVPMGDMVTMARLFARSDIRTPRTWVFARSEDIQIALQEITYPCLFRVRENGRGRKIFIAHHAGDMLQIAESIGKSGKPFLVQEVVQPIGEDIRAMVIGGKVVCAIARRGPEGFIRPKESDNPHVQSITLNDYEQAFTISCARAYHAPYAAVSFSRGADGMPVLLEVARAPALDEMENHTGANIAAAIINLCVAEVNRRNR